MKLIHNIGDRKYGSNYNSLEEVMACADDLSFDGVYTSIYENRVELAKLKQKKILFIVGKYIGLDNSFDLPNLPPGAPLERFCDWTQIYTLVAHYGFELGYHSWSHEDLTQLSDKQLLYELQPPCRVKYFAYPYGFFNHNVIDAVKKAGYEKAFTVFEGDNSNYQTRREFINW